MKPRSAKAAGHDFPYRSKTTCYIEVLTDGTVLQGVDIQAYERARAGESRLFAVWPGQYRSDLFIIDDLDEYAKAFGLIKDHDRTGLAEHHHRVRWVPHPRSGDNPRSPYMTIEVEMLCGCEIRDICAFASEMREQYGWDIATSAGWGGHGAPGGNWTYSLRARKKEPSEIVRSIDTELLLISSEVGRLRW